jgi:hypothetical protein
MEHVNNSRRQGVSYRPWAEHVIDLLKEHNVDIPEKEYFHEWYNADFNYQEALLKCQIRQLKRVWMEIHVKHGSGEFSTSFRTSENARVFFKKFPELRKELD